MSPIRARHLASNASLSVSQALYCLGQTPFPFLVQKKASGGVVKIRQVRKTCIGKSAAEVDEVSGAAWAFGVHNLELGCDGVCPLVA